MRNLALCYLWNELEGRRAPPDDLEGWFVAERQANGGRFFPFLVEPPGAIETFYVLSTDPNDADVAVLTSYGIDSLDGNPASHLPFNQPSGPQSPQLGPVIKRTCSKAKGAGPTTKILNATLQAFREIAQSRENWSRFFAEAADVWSRPRVKLEDNMVETRAGECALHTAVRVIPETTNTVFLTFRDSAGRLPGDVPEYVSYLSSVLAETKYASAKVPSAPIPRCPLCGRENVTGYASACSGAGLNIANIDRPGAFPGVDEEHALLGYALCVDCADLLYIFKFNVLDSFTAAIAHEKALVIPHLRTAEEQARCSANIFSTYVEGLGDQRKQSRTVAVEKRQLLHTLAEDRAVTSIDILWADFGQKLSNIHGRITDILPARLLVIHKANQEFSWSDLPFAPRFPMEDFSFDLQFGFLQSLLRRPGGRKAKSANASKNLFEVRRAIAAALYHGEEIPETRFWEEVMRTTQWFLIDATASGNPVFSLLYEGHSGKKETTWLTLAGWVRHLAVALEYFRYMNVIKKEVVMRVFEPACEKIKPFFGGNGGIDSNEKAFAFLLGLLYGRVMMIQALRGVNVGTNALTWLKRLTLKGQDLPELFVKVREKQLAYEAERSELAREVVAEIVRLGCTLGTHIQLTQTDCCYFLLLGQAMSTEVFKKEKMETVQYA